MNGLESVHFLQNSYRKILNTMSMPGVIEKLDEEFNREIRDIGFLYGSYSIMRVLLDTEATFALACDNEREVAKTVNQITGGVRDKIKESQFIFIDLKNRFKLDEVLCEVSVGTLVSPERGATIICEVEDIYSGDDVLMSGPGIKGTKKLKMPLLKIWKDIREERVNEYPMGVDLIFVDKQGNIISIPRTVKIVEEKN